MCQDEKKEKERVGFEYKATIILADPNPGTATALDGSKKKAVVTITVK